MPTLQVPEVSFWPVEDVGPIAQKHNSHVGDPPKRTVHCRRVGSADRHTDPEQTPPVFPRTRSVFYTAGECPVTKSQDLKDGFEL